MLVEVVDVTIGFKAYPQRWLTMKEITYGKGVRNDEEDWSFALFLYYQPTVRGRRIVLLHFLLFSALCAFFAHAIKFVLF